MDLCAFLVKKHADYAAAHSSSGSATSQTTHSLLNMGDGQIQRHLVQLRGGICMNTLGSGCFWLGWGKRDPAKNIWWCLLQTVMPVGWNTISSKQKFCNSLGLLPKDKLSNSPANNLSLVFSEPHKTSDNVYIFISLVSTPSGCSFKLMFFK